MDADPKSVWDAISTRRSVRSFDGEPIEDGKLERCLQAARLAPSWANKQCWHFVVVKGKKALDESGIVPMNIRNPAAVIVACGDPARSGNREGKPYYLVDVAIAVEQLVLEAWELGLGTVWVGFFNEDKVKKALGIPENIRVVALVPIGYPSEKKSITEKLMKTVTGIADRKDLKEIVHQGNW